MSEEEEKDTVTGIIISGGSGGGSQSHNNSQGLTSVELDSSKVNINILKLYTY